MSDDEALDVWAENMKLEGEIERLRAEVATLRAERDECERQLQSSFSKMGEILEERNVLRAAKVELLRLFDEAMEGYGDCMNYKSEYLVQKHEDQENFAELRAAAAALKETGD